MAKKQLGVIFGSRSCEREVAIISAVQLMRHADPEKYEAAKKDLSNIRKSPSIPTRTESRRFFWT